VSTQHSGVKFSGDFVGRVTPVPIPNTEVKPAGADGTARVTVWESRKSPGLFKKARSLIRAGFFDHADGGHTRQHASDGNPNPPKVLRELRSRLHKGPREFYALAGSCLYQPMDLNFASKCDCHNPSAVLTRVECSRLAVSYHRRGSNQTVGYDCRRASRDVEFQHRTRTAEERSG
jgi:hypothetical protein